MTTLYLLLLVCSTTLSYQDCNLDTASSVIHIGERHNRSVASCLLEGKAKALGRINRAKKNKNYKWVNPEKEYLKAVCK